jgi:aconitate decarboxylase
MAATLLNSTFIQGFELDDFHGDAPLHSNNSIVLPALFAAVQHTSTEISGPIDAPTFLLATIVGCETGSL